ncbi:MAG: heavy metal translocating P-type ATPase metal-binding domain-containing protein, partial [Bacteroidota bacterium]
MKQSLSEQTCCDHCGDPCDDSIGTIHHFCCYGCKAVYELIRDHDLSGFYNETSLQNKSISEVKAERKYAFLDNKDAQKELLSFHDEELSVVRLSTPAIHCSSCIFLLEHLHHFSDEILRSVVHFGKKEVTVTFQNSFSLKDVAILLSQLGYPPYVSLESLDKTKKHVKKSSLGTKIAVAGFCFGNCMLMSMPDYLDSKMLLTDQFKTLFNWINLAFALPSMLYAGWDYFSSAWKGFLHKNLNVDIPISIGILTLFIRSFYEITTFTGTGYFDSLTGLIFFLLLGKWYQSKTYQALSFERDYTSYFPISVTCLIDGEEYHRTLKELKKGDIVIIHNEELIPADGIIINGSGNIDYSFVTGESTPKSIQNGGAVYAGGRQMGGELVVKLQESVNNSELTQLWNKEEFDKERVNFQSLVDKISVYFTGVILVIAGVSAVYWWLNDQSLIWNSVSAVLIVACPCALALVLPFAYGHAMRVVGKQGLFLRNAHVIETMAKIKSIIFDKTGTLTQNSAEVVYEGDKMTKTE